MADLDTSSYGKAPPPPNLLQSYGQVVGIQNAQQQNRLLQQQQDLRAGMGAAVQGAVDPTTGQVNTNKLLGTVSQDPRTAWNFGDVNQQTQANATATAQAQQEQLKNVQAHIVAVNGYLGGLIGDAQLGKADLHDKIVQSITDMAAHGASMSTPAELQQQIAAVPHDPAAQLDLVRSKVNQSLSMQGQIQQVLGAPTAISTGGQTNIVRTPVAGGAPQQVGALNNTLSPGEKVQGQATVAPSGQAGTVPVGTRFDQFGNVLPAGSQPAAPPAATMPGAGPAGSVNALASPAAPPSGAPATAAPQPAAPSGFLPTAQPPGVASSQDADVTRYKADQALIPQHATNVQSLQKAQGALMAVGTGKGSGSLNTMLSYINTLDPSGTVAARIQNYDEAKKYLTDYARQQGAAAHSDLQLQAAEGSNASTDISNAAALDVVKTNIGRERQAIAQAQEQPNGTGIGYGKHAANFATSTDPRAFAWDQYTPDERTKILSGLKGAALQKFKDSIVIAARNGLISPPR